MENSNRENGKLSNFAQFIKLICPYFVCVCAFGEPIQSNTFHFVAFGKKAKKNKALESFTSVRFILFY